MDKEDFLQVAMDLLKQYISEDEGIASNLLEAQGVDTEEIDSVLYTIRNWRS